MPLEKPLFVLAVGLAVPVSAMALATPRTHGQDQRERDVKAAMGVAEAETGGEAVTVRRVAMNGTSSPDGLGGFEVLVHMPRAKTGWRCLIDSNNLRLRRKEPIPNPPSKVR